MIMENETLAAISSMSAELYVAENDPDPKRLAALIAACRTVEARALATLANRVSQTEILAAQSAAVSTLGW